MHTKKSLKRKTNIKAGDVYLHNPPGSNDRNRESGGDKPLVVFIPQCKA